MLRFREIDVNFPSIFRVFISGCSSAGKTFFARQLLDQIDYGRLYYCHPDLHEYNPVDWNLDIIFTVGLPTLEEIMNMPENSCIILDDLFHECKDSSTIDYLFRVLSGKRNIHCTIMTQRYFSSGKYALNIRNSCNYHVLMRNADEHVNLRAARTMNLAKEYLLADQLNKNELYPYVFIDKTNYGRVNQLQLYIDIFSKHKKVVMKNGLYYLITAQDFNSQFTKIDNQTAKHEPAKSKDTLEQSSQTKTKYNPRTKYDLEQCVEKIIRRRKKRAFLQRKN